MKLMVLDGNSVINRAYYGVRTMLTESSTASARHKRLDRFCIYKTPSQTFGSSLRRSVFLMQANLKNQLLRDLTSACRRAMKSGRASTLCSPERVRTEMVSFSASLSPRTSMYGIFWLCASRIL